MAIAADFEKVFTIGAGKYIYTLVFYFIQLPSLILFLQYSEPKTVTLTGI